MIALYAHDLVVLAIAIVSSGFVSTVIHAYMPTLRRSAGRIGDYAAREAVPILLGALPANGLFRAAVAYELRTLASQADMIEASVSTRGRTGSTYCLVAAVVSSIFAPEARAMWATVSW